MAKRLKCSVAEYWESSTLFRQGEVLILKCPGNILRIDAATNDHQLHRIARELRAFTSLITRHEGIVVAGQFYDYLAYCRQHCLSSSSDSSDQSGLWYIWGGVNAVSGQNVAVVANLIEDIYSDYYEFFATDENEAMGFVARLQNEHDAEFLQQVKDCDHFSQGCITPDYHRSIYRYDNQGEKSLCETN